MKRELINQIIRKLADNVLPESRRDTVLRWLTGQQDGRKRTRPCSGCGTKQTQRMSLKKKP